MQETLFSSLYICIGPALLGLYVMVTVLEYSDTRMNIYAAAMDLAGSDRIRLAWILHTCLNVHYDCEAV